MFVNAKQLIMYKMLHKYLTFLHTTTAWSWLNEEIKVNPYYLHAMFCLLQSAVISITTCLYKNEKVVARLLQNEITYNPSCTKSATGAGDHFVINAIIELEQPAASHTNMPKRTHGTNMEQEKPGDEP